ncbi:MAG: UMP kinase [Bacillota bacterium]|nr:UMP kinase [Bacillota bacterium]
MSDPVYRRILLKLSGEALAGSRGHGLDNATLGRLAAALHQLPAMGVEPAIVVGGGNFWRGRTSGGMDRVTADHMGMLATTMNALALSDALEQLGSVTRVMSAIEMRQICETYIRKRALRHLEKGRIVIFAGGTGNPYFSTDSAMALRAAEIGADVTLKATNVDGVYDSDPRTNPDARLYRRLTHDDILQNRLQVMDSNAAAICRDNHLRIIVFNMDDPENILRIVRGETIGTLVE